MASKTPIISETEVLAVPEKQPRRLVLCFDGTGNKFSGLSGDTNIVKIFQMLDRSDPDQYHYYQPGIGTYQVNYRPSSSGIGHWAKFKNTVYSIYDEGVGATFVDHVLAGYKFLMRYFEEGDHVYIFGFSRGAYTARFLAEMIYCIGMLSKGNEEIINFAWETFSDYQNRRGNDPQSTDDIRASTYVKDFKKTFCRADVEVHFLGLFDCVNSVGQFEIPMNRTSYQYMAMPAARHIRHAISIHERRLKFRPALFGLPADSDGVDCKEMWFAGNHGDVGGGWALEPGQDALLSDIPLEWMLEEVRNLPNSTSKLRWKEKEINDHCAKVKLLRQLDSKTQAVHNHWTKRQLNQPHDMLRFGCGATNGATLRWWIVECLPLFTRLELDKNGKWVPKRWPPNWGSNRDIPNIPQPLFHDTVQEMVAARILDKMPRVGGN